MISADQTRAYFRRYFGTEPQALCCAPGRVNLIGEHIDYAGGQVLPISLAQGISVAARPNSMNVLRMISDGHPETGLISVAGGEDPRGFAGYILQLAIQAGLSSVDLAIASDLPPGRGLSSSAALGVAVQGVLAAMSDAADRPPARMLCKSAQTAEHLALGTNCGLMDQYASMFGSADKAILIDTWRENHHYLPLNLESYSLLLVDSGQSRDLAASQYNRRHKEMDAALAAARRQAGGFECFRELQPQRFRETIDSLPDPARLRLMHLTTEQGRVFAFGKALEAGDGVAMGQLLNDSQASLRDNAEVSTPQIDRLVALLQAMPHCLGCRLIGGGFGGSVLALLAGEPDPATLELLLRQYQADTGLNSDWLVVQPGPGAWLEDAQGQRQSLREFLS